MTLLKDISRAYYIPILDHQDDCEDLSADQATYSNLNHGILIKKFKYD